MTPQEARQELARRELARRGASAPPAQPPNAFARATAKYATFAEPPGRVGFNPLTKMMTTIQKPFDAAGQRTAEGLARMGARPQDAAFVGTAIQMAPDIAGAIAGGIAEPKLGPAQGNFATRALEDWSGVKPGALAQEFEDPSLIFSKGKAGARPYYQTVQEQIENSKILSDTKNNEAVVNKLYEKWRTGALTEGEALEGRKAADTLRKSPRTNQNWLMKRRNIFDKIVKNNANLAEGDIAYKRGTLAESMRTPFPRNVGGRASPFKVGESMVLAKLGPLGKVAGALASPIVQGGLYGTLGLGAKVAQNPGAIMAALQLLRRQRENANQNPNP